MASLQTEPLRRVLVVDDDRDVREAVAEVLAAHGYSVGQAIDGAEGLAAFERERPEVVIADLEMPRLRGVELLRRVRAIDASTTVVLMTGYATLDLAIQAMKEGAADFLVKPIRVNRLLSTLGAAVPPTVPPPRPAIEPQRARRHWLGTAEAGRAFAGSFAERSGAIVLYAGEVVDDGPEARLTTVLADDAITGLAERVGSPERVLLVAGQAVGAALEGGRPEIVAAMARIAPDGRSLAIASAGVAAWLVDADGPRSLVPEGRTERLVTAETDVAYPMASAKLESGALVVLATPSLVRSLGGEQAFAGWLARHAGGGEEGLLAATAKAAATAAPDALMAAALAVRLAL